VQSIFIKMKEDFRDFGKAFQHVQLELLSQIHSCLLHMNLLRKNRNNLLSDINNCEEYIFKISFK
jgi:hypothetical protein